MRSVAYVFGLVCFVISASAFAMTPVIDFTEIAKTSDLIVQAENQLKQLEGMSKAGLDQYNFLQQDLKGNFGYGSLLNDASSLNQRQWSNDSWVDVLNGSSSGNASAFSSAQKTYDKLYPVLRPDQIVSTRGQDNLARTHYQQSSEISRAALAASAYSYDQLNEHIKNLHDMLQKLDSEESEKAAIDMNARLVAEIGFIQLELLRQQTIQNQLTATTSQGEVNGMSDQAKFMQWRP